MPDCGHTPAIALRRYCILMKVFSVQKSLSLGVLNVAVAHREEGACQNRLRQRAGSRESYRPSVAAGAYIRINCQPRITVTISPTTTQLRLVNISAIACTRLLKAYPMPT